MNLEIMDFSTQYPYHYLAIKENSEFYYARFYQLFIQSVMIRGEHVASLEVEVIKDNFPIFF